MPMPAARDGSEKTPRQKWMSVLARASLHDVEAALSAAGGYPAYEILKQPETGTVMLEARAGGSGRRFNLGEATVTRAVVRFADGRMGFAYALGSDRRKAELSAILDALLQDPANGDALCARLIVPIAERQAARHELVARKAARTKVDFFTLAREHT